MKYTPEQLGQMAREALVARDSLDVRWLELIVRLAQVCGMHPNDVSRNIERLAKE